MTLPDFEIFQRTLDQRSVGKQAYIRSGFMPPKSGSRSRPITTLTDYMTSAPSPNSLLVWTQHGEAKIEESPAQGYRFLAPQGAPSFGK